MLSFRDYLLRGRHERIPANEEEVSSLSIPFGIAEHTNQLDSTHTNDDGTRNTGTINQHQTITVNVNSSDGGSDETVSLRAPSATNSISHSDSTANTETDAPSGADDDATATDADADTDTDADADADANDGESHIISPELSELIVEREHYRRGSKTCTAIIGFILFRMWVEAIINVDVVLIICDFFLTSYFIGWRFHRSATDYELGERIEETLRREEADLEAGEGEREEGRRSRRVRRFGGPRGTNFDEWDINLGRNRDHMDLEMLGFQAQLALAIMESQRHILDTGGYGRPGGEEEGQMTGVSEDTKIKWDAFEYNVNDPKVKKCADLKPHKNEDPSCCICLCEYEEGEMLNQLGCGHVYHKECIDSWCQHHTRCPLCNLNLEDSNNNEK